MKENLTLLFDRIALNEVGMSLALIIITTVVLAVTILQLTDDRRFSLITAASNVISTLLSLLVLVVVYLLPQITLHNLYYFVFIIPFVFNVSNLLASAFEYSRLLSEKGFDIDYVSRGHFNSSLQTSAVLILTALTLIAFIPREISFIISLSLLVIIPTFTVNNLLIRKYLK